MMYLADHPNFAARHREKEEEKLYLQPMRNVLLQLPTEELQVVIGMGLRLFMEAHGEYYDDATVMQLYRLVSKHPISGFVSVNQLKKLRSALIAFGFSDSAALEIAPRLRIRQNGSNAHP